MALPVTLENLREHLNSSFAEDGLVSEYLAAAQGWVEGYTGFLLSPRQVSESFDRLAPRTTLQNWPVQEITSVVYFDTGGTEREFSIQSARLVNAQRPARVALLGSLPYAPRSPGAVTITYQAGLPADQDAPPAFAQAIRLLVGEYYLNREAGSMSRDADRAVSGLLRPFRHRTL